MSLHRFPTPDTKCVNFDDLWWPHLFEFRSTEYIHSPGSPVELTAFCRIEKGCNTKIKSCFKFAHLCFYWTFQPPPSPIPVRINFFLETRKRLFLMEIIAMTFLSDLKFMTAIVFRSSKSYPCTSRIKIIKPNLVGKTSQVFAVYRLFTRIPPNPAKCARNWKKS